VKIYLSTEGTYPFVVGGVSTWADLLVRGLPDHEFHVAAIVDNPFYRLAFELPPNVTLQPVPLWGSEMAEEYLRAPGSWRRAWRTSSTEVRRHFLPCWDPFISALASPEANLTALGDALAEVAKFAERHDLRRALASRATWLVLLEQLRSNALMARTSTQGAIDFGRALFRFLLPLSAPIPRCDVVHTSAAGLCALPAVVAKYRYGTPMVLTEHGIYLRERFMALAPRRVEEKFLVVNFFRAVTELTYREADILTPVCGYNAGWEAALGVDRRRVRVIYNGSNDVALSSLPLQPPPGPPTVGYVGRIDPLKDVVTLIRAFSLVRKAVPTARLLIWGPASSQSYLAHCKKLASSLGLLGDGSGLGAPALSFEGPTGDLPAAYGACHVIALSSVTEGFPYTVVEAMLAARPTVATDVGGVSEALGGIGMGLSGTGLLVEPGDPWALAASLSAVLLAPEAERLSVGIALRARALERFGIAGFLSAYSEVYERLAEPLPSEFAGASR
jgi:glycosyltransferase involved in cell wall biosynthesis